MTGFDPKTIVFLQVFPESGSELPFFDERVAPNEEPMVKTEGLLNVFPNLLRELVEGNVRWEEDNYLCGSRLENDWFSLGFERFWLKRYGFP